MICPVGRSSSWSLSIGLRGGQCLCQREVGGSAGLVMCHWKKPGCLGSSFIPHSILKSRGDGVSEEIALERVGMKCLYRLGLSPPWKFISSPGCEEIVIMGSPTQPHQANVDVSADFCLCLQVQSCVSRSHTLPYETCISESVLGPLSARTTCPVHWCHPQGGSWT